MGLLAFLLYIVSATATSVLAQNYIPIEVQLRSAYRPQTYQQFLNSPISYSEPTPILPAPTPTSSLTKLAPTPAPPTPEVLGASTSSNQTIKIAILGDSMTDTLGPDFPKLTEALYRYYPSGISFSILNYGKGSDTIEGGARRLVEDYEYKDQTIPNLISQKPDIIIVESFAYNNLGNTQDGFERHWLNLGAIISTIKAKLPDTKILVASTIAPNAIIFAKGAPGVTFTGLERVEKTQTIKYYLERTNEYAKTNGYPLADIYTPSLVGANGDRLYIDDIDGIHPSGPGKELIATILAKTIYDNQLVKPY